MKVAVSLPDRLFEAADRLARRLGISRSALYARALDRLTRSANGADVTQALDAVYERENSAMDRAWMRAQSAATARQDW